ncbi:hypothetical protein EON68_04380, partial [archaeon]
GRNVCVLRAAVITLQNATPADFEVMRALSSWAISFEGPPRGTPSPAATSSATPLAAGAGAQHADVAPTMHALPHSGAATAARSWSASRKARLGHACKRLLDAGRVHFLNHLPQPTRVGGDAATVSPLTARVMCYADRTTTPESFLILYAPV